MKYPWGEYPDWYGDAPQALGVDGIEARILDDGSLELRDPDTEAVTQYRVAPDGAWEHRRAAPEPGDWAAVDVSLASGVSGIYFHWRTQCIDIEAKHGLMSLLPVDLGFDPHRHPDVVVTLHPAVRVVRFQDPRGDACPYWSASLGCSEIRCSTGEDAADLIPILEAAGYRVAIEAVLPAY